MLQSSTITECNGGYYFGVKVYHDCKDGQTVEICSVMDNVKGDTCGEVLLEFKDVKKVFFGIDNAFVTHGSSYKYKKDGNSVLFITKQNTCVFVSRTVVEFDISNEEVQYLYSPTLNSSVVYAYVTTDKNTFLVSEIKDGKLPFIENKNLGTKNCYDYYYNHNKINGDTDVCDGYIECTNLLKAHKK